MTYRTLAEILSDNYNINVMAHIYMEIKQFESVDMMSDDLIDKYVEYGYKYWENSSYVEPTKIGLALFYGLQHIFEYNNKDDLDINDIRAVFDYGWSSVVL